ncbi:MAG TPA: potassium/proton antiporter [Xanthobacteraceae bacterium]|nr:potassium/proton antiporter [Xanthobacteraceae bacterium]
MAALDSVSLTIMFAALLVLAGILSSLIALRFGAPLLLVFLLVGMLAGESGPGGIKFDDVHTTYLVGSVALALILFDGGLRMRLPIFRSVLAPSLVLATAGVLLTAALTAPVAWLLLGFGWIESLLVGAVVASTDAAAVFLLIHAHGLRLRPRVAATLEVESGTNDPFAIFLTIALVELALVSDEPWYTVLDVLAVQAIGGAVIGWLGGRVTVIALNRLELPQGLHAPLVMTGALVVFGIAQALQGSGFLAVYLAGLIVGNRPTRAHNAVIAFLDAATWLAQIIMFVLVGLLVWPTRLLDNAVPALAVAAALMFFARPVAVFSCLAPFRFSWREKAFISWVGLRGAVGIFLASIPLLVGMRNAFIFFDIGFAVVLISLLVQGWTITFAAHRLQIALRRGDPAPRRVELDLPGQLEHELVGYAVSSKNPYMRLRVVPSWAKLMLVVRDQRVLAAAEADEIREGDHAYFLAPPEKAQALDRFFVEMPPPSAPDLRLLGDFFVSGDVTLGTLGEIYGVVIAPEDMATTLSDWFATHLPHKAKVGDRLPLGAIQLVVDGIAKGRITTVGLDLAETPESPAPGGLCTRIKQFLRRAFARLRGG